MDSSSSADSPRQPPTHLETTQDLTAFAQTTSLANQPTISGTQRNIYPLSGQRLIGRQFAIPQPVQQPTQQPVPQQNQPVVNTPPQQTLPQQPPQQQQQQQQPQQPQAPFPQQPAQQQPVQAMAAPTISLKLPEPRRFNGTSTQLNSWVYSIEVYFSACGLDFANAHSNRAAAVVGSLLEGPAQQWHRRLSLTNALPNDYPTLIAALRDHFGVVDETRRARDQLKTLKQIKTVLEYIKSFENVTMSIPTATDEELRHAFTFGLKPTVRTNVLLHQPATLQQAQVLAMAAEELRYDLPNEPSPFPKNKGKIPYQ